MILFGFVGGCSSDSETKGNIETNFRSPREADEKSLCPIDVEGEEATEPRTIDEEIDQVASVSEEADVIVVDEDSDKEHVSVTPRLRLPSPSARPAPFPRAEFPEYPAPEAATRPKGPEPFIITRDMWEELRKSQGMVLHALNTNGHRIKRIRRD
jgi:hypothetical protein